MRLDVVTIFPDYLDPLRHALLGKAIEKGILEVGVHDLRQWATGVHQAVDDSPYGGGPGMVMKPDVWGPALDDVAAGTGPAAIAGTAYVAGSAAIATTTGAATGSAGSRGSAANSASASRRPSRWP